MEIGTNPSRHSEATPPRPQSAAAISTEDAIKRIDAGWNLAWGRDDEDNLVVSLRRRDLSCRCRNEDFAVLKQHALNVQGSRPRVQVPEAVDPKSLDDDTLNEYALGLLHAVNACVRQKRELIMAGRGWQCDDVHDVQKKCEAIRRSYKAELLARGQNGLRTPYAAVWAVACVLDGAGQEVQVEAPYFASCDNARGYAGGSPTTAEMVANNDRAEAAFKAQYPLGVFKSLRMVRVYRRGYADAK